MMAKPTASPILNKLAAFMHGEAASGIVLLAAAALALAVANSPMAEGYFHLLHAKAGPLSIQHWINDALMALFFLLIGLEVKREFLIGALSDWPSRMLPGALAVAGMAAPAIIFTAINIRKPEDLAGWAIPTATDIAFALGILALLGGRAPASIKVLLTAIAVIDDILAIVVIALFYTAQLMWLPLLAALAGIGILILLNRAGVRALWPYLVIGMGVWAGVFLSGIHATLAGVAVALTIPLSRDADANCPLSRLEHAIHPWVAFAIVPLFGLANAGVSFAGMTPATVIAPLPLGIMLGLFAGKQIGVFGAGWIMVRAGIAKMPEAASWRQMWGMATLCGIGFTMSLFIGALAFPGAERAQDAVKLGVLGGSLLAGIGGWLIFSGARSQGEA